MSSELSFQTEHECRWSERNHEGQRTWRVLDLRGLLLETTNQTSPSVDDLCCRQQTLVIFSRPLQKWFHQRRSASGERSRVALQQDCRRSRRLVCCAYRTLIMCGRPHLPTSSECSEAISSWLWLWNVAAGLRADPRSAWCQFKSASAVCWQWQNRVFLIFQWLLLKENVVEYTCVWVWSPGEHIKLYFRVIESQSVILKCFFVVFIYLWEPPCLAEEESITFHGAFIPALFSPL